MRYLLNRTTPITELRIHAVDISPANDIIRRRCSGNIWLIYPFLSCVFTAWHTHASAVYTV